MERKNQTAFAALAAAGVLWGLTVPLSKLSMAWLGPAWLTVARFSVAAPVLALIARRDLRDALSARVIVAGAVGFGGVILLQNIGVQHTSVSHAAVVVGAVPLLVAVISAALGHGRVRARAWAGFALALGGIALVAGAAGGGATVSGDLLVLASAALSAAFIVGQARLLEHRDATAVTAVQFAAGALVALPIALLTANLPAAPASPGPVLAFVALALAGTLMAFWLFAFGQTRVKPQLAGAFVNLEPVVGAAVGWLAFGNPASLGQLGGAAAVLAGIALSTMPRPARGGRPASSRGRRASSGGRHTPRLAVPRARPTRRAETRPRGCCGSRPLSGKGQEPLLDGRRPRAYGRRPQRAGARSRRRRSQHPPPGSPSPPLSSEGLGIP
jgi:drug/metabolite transporter (DMT)-like permease